MTLRNANYLMLKHLRRHLRRHLRGQILRNIRRYDLPANNALQHYLRQQPPDLLNFLASDNSNSTPQEVAQKLAAALSAQAAAQVAAVQRNESNNNKKPRLNNNNGEDDEETNNMKVPPISLNGIGQSGAPLPFSADFLWRFPNPYLSQPPPSPLESQLKAQLPGGLGHDPRNWARDDVNIFLRYCEREFDLEKIDMEKFQMNGKALCLLSKTDLAERCAGAGDVIHNILQMLIRETTPNFPPSSPLTPRPPLMTPTSPAMPLSPHPWPLLSPSVAAAAAAAASAASDTFPNLSHLINQTNSVTLSPAPSMENGTSPKNGDIPTSIHQLYPHPGSSLTQAAKAAAQAMAAAAVASNNNKMSVSASSSHSDSEDSSASPDAPRHYSPKSAVASRSPTSTSMQRPQDATSTSGANGVKEEPTPELNTNGRLLWDFLQQLLNDAQQRYTNYIAWKNKDTGVFKIVDPAGLAKLWGIQKNHLSMNYDKMSRALRYYYRVNILRKVQGERHCYQFLRNPSELKSIKNISLLRQQMEAQAAAQKLAAQRIANLSQVESMQEQTYVNPSSPPSAQAPTSSDDLPTDLSLDADEKKARLRERLEQQHHQRSTFASATILPAEPRDEEERDREQHDPRPAFDFRLLMPQVTLKTEQC